MPRRVPIFQFPNPPLLATMAAAAIARMTRGKASRAAMQLARLGLLWWSAEEIMSGANWFRRLLGAAAGAYSLATLKTRAPERLDEGVLRARDQDMPGVCLASRARPIALQPEHRKATEQR